MDPLHPGSDLPRIHVPVHAEERRADELREGDVVYRPVAAAPGHAVVLGVVRMIDRHPLGVLACLFESSRSRCRQHVVALTVDERVWVVRAR